MQAMALAQPMGAQHGFKSRRHQGCDVVSIADQHDDPMTFSCTMTDEVSAL